MVKNTRLTSLAKTFFSKKFCLRFVTVLTVMATATLFSGADTKDNADNYKSISIIDANNHYDVVTKTETVEEAIALTGIALNENDIVSSELDSATKDGDKIYLNRSKLIKLETSGTVFEFYTNENTVGEALFADGFLVGKYDEVVPDVNTATEDGMTVSVRRVYVTVSETTEELPYETVTVDNPDQYMGYSKVLKAGVNGQTTRTYKMVSREGAGTTAILIGETTKAPVTEVLEVGTKLITPESMTVIKGSTADGIPYSALPAMAQNNSKTVITGNTAITPYGTFKFSKIIDFKATAYEGSSASNGIWAGQTATGRDPVYGVVAVDPRVIPLNSKLYIESADKGQSWIYGFCVAGDTGGAIKGKRVDLCYSTLEQCYQFGRRNCRVYILE